MCIFHSCFGKNTPTTSDFFIIVERIRIFGYSYNFRCRQLSLILNKLTNTVKLKNHPGIMATLQKYKKMKYPGYFCNTIAKNNL